MSTKAKDLRDGSLWRRKKGGYQVRVEHSAPAGVTTYRRVIPLSSSKPRLCSMQTKAFVKVFERAAH